MITLVIVVVIVAASYVINAHLDDGGMNVFLPFIHAFRVVVLVLVVGGVCLIVVDVREAYGKLLLKLDIGVEGGVETYLSVVSGSFSLLYCFCGYVISTLSMSASGQKREHLLRRRCCAPQ